ncbi:MAG: dipicolinate synthase subunit B [Firmicutes bacterium]|nr:dipicolinate synthase subunit B [Bacillota bacterium]
MTAVDFAENGSWQESLRGKTVGVGLTGSFCTMRKVLDELKRLKSVPGVELVPILSENVQRLDSKFGRAAEWREALAAMGAREPILTIPQAEPIGPSACLDVLMLAPCTGNTMAKLACGITDGPVLMAAKAHLRNQKPLLIAPASNDALAANAKNLGMLLNSKNVFFVPMGQDDPERKPTSLIFDAQMLLPALGLAVQGRQIQPILRQY